MIVLGNAGLNPASGHSRAKSLGIIEIRESLQLHLGMTSNLSWCVLRKCCLGSWLRGNNQPEEVGQGLLPDPSRSRQQQQSWRTCRATLRATNECAKRPIHGPTGFLLQQILCSTSQHIDDHHQARSEMRWRPRHRNFPGPSLRGFGIRTAFMSTRTSPRPTQPNQPPMYAPTKHNTSEDGENLRKPRECWALPPECPLPRLDRRSPMLPTASASTSTAWARAFRIFAAEPASWRDAPPRAIG